MYTRCPDCRTPFKITRAQLAARAGRVRCGKCGAVFVATDQLLDVPPAPGDAIAADAHGKRGGAAAGKRRRRNPSADHNRRAHGQTRDDASIPELAFPTARRRARSLAWGLASLALLLLLAAQLVFFYPDEIARHGALKPAVTELCRVLDCQLASPAPAPLPELTATTIAPHPRFANGLRIRAVMVNRGAAARPYPLLDVSLSDSNGTVLARRTFKPNQYLERPPADGSMPPNIAVNALIDVTNPDGKAVGYEIQVLPPDEIHAE